MKSGTQSILQHRVVWGNIKKLDKHLRYCISFRKSRPDTQQIIDGSSPANNHVSPPTERIHKTQTTLIVGDSFAARLDPIKLSKGRKNVVNIAKGGNKINDDFLFYKLLTFNCGR